jgi:methylated-DNA-[protein]-cysteine S-methyltransferase
MSKDAKECKCALFETAIGTCGVVWTMRGIKAVQLPLPDENKTRTRIRQRYGELAEATPPAGV